MEISRRPKAGSSVAAGTGNLVKRFGSGVRRKSKTKNAGLKAVTLIATLNPVSQVLW
jgi:hypothetical protein